MKKVSKNTLSVLLTLLITLPIAIVALPIGLNPLLVKAASATITLAPTEGYVGDYLTVTGNGFTPNKDVKFVWGTEMFSALGFISGMPSYQRPSISPTVGGQVHTDSLGNFIVQLQVPKLTKGTYTIKADDTQTSAQADFTINAKVLLRNTHAYKTHGTTQTPVQSTASKYYIGLFLAEGFVGDELALQLSGFGDGEQVQVKIGDTAIGASGDFIVSTGTAKGYLFDTTIGVIPEMIGGTYTVTATGLLSATTATATFTVKPELFLAKPGTANLGFPWLYSSGHFGLGWYSSICPTVGEPNSEFRFEATGLSGDVIDTVTLTYSGGTVTTTLSGTYSISGKGSTNEIKSTTVPFVSATPFDLVSSPKAKIQASITPSDAVLSVVIKTKTTIGVAVGTFTFPNQLFASVVGTDEMAGDLMWLEGQGTITNDGSYLSDINDNNDVLVARALKAGTSYSARLIDPSGTTVQETDEDGLWMDPLAWTDQDPLTGHPMSFYDADSDGVWDTSDDVYQDWNHNQLVDAGDFRINRVALAPGYWPWSTVLVGDSDVVAARPLKPFEDTKHPAIDTWWFNTVYLDLNGDNVVSAGDIRVSFDRESDLATGTADSNGFLALRTHIQSIWGWNFPGGGKEYNIGLWNFVGVSTGVQAGNSVTMQIQAHIDLSTPTAYQSTLYVTEKSDVTVSGNGFFGSEPVQIFVGEEYMTQVTPSTYGDIAGTAIVMPHAAGGEQPIKAQGIITTDNTASDKVTFTPTLGISPSFGYNLNPITAITVTGMGFEADTYQIIFDGAGTGKEVTSPFTVEATGDFAGQINIAFNLPIGVEGYHIVDVVKTSDPTKSALYGLGYLETDGDARVGAPFPTDSEFPKVTIRPSLQRVPSSTVVGTSVTVTGEGLKPSTTYYIWYDPRGTSTSQAVLMTTTPANVTTNTEGSLTGSFQIPQSGGGDRNIWVSTSNTFVNIDPILGTTVSILITIRPAAILAQSSGAPGASIAVSFTGLSFNGQYQLWWCKPEDVINTDIWSGTPEVPQTALPLVTATGTLYGNSTAAVSFDVPSTAENGNIYSVDLTYFGTRTSVLSNPVFFTVGKVATSITLSLTPTTVTQGENVTINGVVEPAMSVEVMIFIKSPDGETTNKTVTSSASGTFTDTFTPSKAGTWQVTAKWDGNTVFADYTSLAATVTAKPVDMSWTYALTGLGIGVIALVVGLLVTGYYFMRKRRPAAA